MTHDPSRSRRRRGSQTPPSPDPAFRQKLDAAKRRSTFHLLLKCARLVNERALARVQEQSGRPVRPSHTALFPHIALEGTRLTELAAAVGRRMHGGDVLVKVLGYAGLR